jgi:hypothetical protein
VNALNKPISLEYIDSMGLIHFALLIPIYENLGAVLAQQELKIKQILLPFSYDVPNYNLFFTKKDGSIINYKEYINSGPGVFYPVSLSDVDVQCQDYFQGVLNTFCSFYFRAQ